MTAAPPPTTGPRSAGPRAQSARSLRVEARRPAPPARSFLEVRVAAGRLDVVEFYSHGQAGPLRAALRRLGLLTKQEFDAPCG